MKRLLLIGAGHAHAQVLKDWITAPAPDTELTIVSPSLLAPYSGMVPGWLAGQYQYEDICIHLAALAAAARARLVIDELASLDAARQQIVLVSGATLNYDVLSLNVGSTLSPPLNTKAQVLSLRPLGDLRQAWEALLSELATSRAAGSLKITAIGGGAAGVEALLATLARLRLLQTRRTIEAKLLTRSSALLPGISASALRYSQAALASAGVTVQMNTEYSDAVANSSDLLLWATGAQAYAWQRDCGLAVSASGFIRVDEHLRSVSHPQVCAVGDCAEWAQPLPKAGVYAVRMGPVLSNNLRAALGCGSLVNYVPQSRFLALLNTSDGSAVASWGRLSARGPWVMRWKDHIDRKFLKQFNNIDSSTVSRPTSPIKPS
jgi:pyridine nucleotide-disulfide oxidoreductase family protein